MTEAQCLSLTCVPELAHYRCLVGLVFSPGAVSLQVEFTGVAWMYRSGHKPVRLGEVGGKEVGR